MKKVRTRPLWKSWVAANDGGDCTRNGRTPISCDDHSPGSGVFIGKVYGRVLRRAV